MISFQSCIWQKSFKNRTVHSCFPLQGIRSLLAEVCRWTGTLIADPAQALDVENYLKTKKGFEVFSSMLKTTSKLKVVLRYFSRCWKLPQNQKVRFLNPVGNIGMRNLTTSNQTCRLWSVFFVKFYATRYYSVARMPLREGRITLAHYHQPFKQTPNQAKEGLWRSFLKQSLSNQLHFNAQCHGLTVHVWF